MRKTSIAQLVYSLVVVTVVGSFVRGDLITIGTLKDASIFNESNNNNGAGNLYTGVAGSVVGIRRALLQFDIASSIPVGSTINSVSLRLTQTRHGPNAIVESMEIRPLLAFWGEGTGANAGTGNAPTAGAVTWNFREFNTNAWSPGGSFGPASGSASFGLTNFTATTFSSQPAMVTDVQSWLNTPATNFGWLLKYVNETTGFGAREIASKENATASWRPQLTIDFTPIPEPSSMTLLAMAAMATTRFRRRRA
jgi:PEP-CTERM motif